MKFVKLERFCYADGGTFGDLTTPEGRRFATVERPWLFNRKSISCVPVGEYKCKPRFYHRGGYKAIEVCNVPDRTHILFHIGNFVRNSNGCILINKSFGAINGEWCGLSSKTAFSSFMSELGGSNFTLKISNREGGIL